MTVVLDTSALLALAVDGPQRRVVLDALDSGRPTTKCGRRRRWR